MKIKCFILITILLTVHTMETVKANFLAIGHRGCRDILPENTIASIIHALEFGADGIEVDVHLTRDGKLVVHHDYLLNPNLTRYTDGTWIVGEDTPLHQMNFRDLQLFKVGHIKPDSPYAQEHHHVSNTSDESLPLLEDVFLLLKMHPRAKLLIELKTTPEEPAISSDPDKIAVALAQAIDKSDVKKQCIVLAFEAKVLLKLKQLDPALNLSLNQMPGPKTNSIWYSGYDLKNHNGSVPQMVHAMGIQGWSSYYEQLTPENIKEAHNLGLKVYAWTVNKTQDMEKLIRWGVDGIISDRPDLLVRYRR